MTAQDPKGTKTAAPAQPGLGQDQPTPSAPEITPKAQVDALLEERKKIAVQLEEAKNQKLLAQLEQMKRETAQEAEKAEDRKKGAAALAPPPVPDARIQPRHLAVAASFLVMVVLPLAATIWYLNARAHDRYVSYSGFSVRKEEVSSAFELLGGVAQLSGSSSSDTDILYKFIQSPELVARVNAQEDLRALWTKPGRSWADSGDDPVFSYNPGGTWGAIFGAAQQDSIEDLTSYWSSRVHVYSDSGTGLIDLEVEAFDPNDAQRLAQLIYSESSDMINRLSAIARDDATRYAEEELATAVERLKSAREALTRYRNRTQIVDPSASIQGQMGLLSSLQAQLAQTLIDLDILRQTARDNDPRITQGERRVEVIENRIAEERSKLGLGTDVDGTPREGAFADVIGEYERLVVDLEFAEQSYTAALAAYDSAQAEARRQSRYLAAHVNPTLPESATRPDRTKIAGLVGLIAFLTWAMAVLSFYAMRDRR